MVVAPSSSALKLLVKGNVGFDTTELPVITIGPKTSEMAKSLGFNEVVQCEDDQPAALVSLVMKHLLLNKPAIDMERRPFVQ